MTGTPHHAPAWVWQRSPSPDSPPRQADVPTALDEITFLFQVYDQLHRGGETPGGVTPTGSPMTDYATPSWRWVLRYQTLATLVWALVGSLALWLPTMIGIRWGLVATACLLPLLVAASVFWPSSWGATPLWQLRLAAPMFVFGLCFVTSVGMLAAMLGVPAASVIGVIALGLFVLAAHRLVPAASWREFRDDVRQRLATYQIQEP